MSEPAHDTPRHARRQFRTFGLIWLAMLLVYWSLAACSGGPPTPPPSGDGPRFVVSSPSDGGTTAGTVLFAVQPFNLAEVARVDFEAGGTDLGFDTNATDGFAVFLIAADFPAGDLTLRATARGHDGRESVQEITVTNVPAPPSSATVGAGGAALGTTEAGGALSTLLIPSDAPEGVDVTFEARSKAEVKAATGVDYDALGVTFLGAQEITTSAPLGTPLGISSGGFGPMVQPDQVVVNYMITDDRDGDGIGELVVINTARVAPNGDVVADPVAQIQIGAGVLTTGIQRRALRSLQDDTIVGPPGTRVELEVTGFNAAAALGTLAVYELGDGSTVELPAAVFPNQAGTQTLSTVLPLVDPGPATLTLVNRSTGSRSEAYAVHIEPLVRVTEPAADALAGTLARFREAIDLVRDAVAPPGAAVDPFAPLLASLDDFEEAMARIEASSEPELANTLADLATLIANADIDEQLHEVIDALSSPRVVTASICDPVVRAYINAVSSAGATLGGIGMGVGAVVIGAALAAPTGGASVLVIGGLVFGAGVGTATGALGGYLTVAGLELGCRPQPPCIVPGTPPSTSLRDVFPPPEGLRRQQTGPSSGVTGMGSIVPPGGDACGTVSAAGDPAAGSLRLQQVALDDLLGDLEGRFVVKVFYGAGNSVPFTGVTDAGGYFYLPTVPAGQPFTAIAFDTETQQSRSFEGTGPEIGRSTYLTFDFGAEGPTGATLLAYDTNTEGSHGGTDIYLFDGQAGDVISLAVFSEELRSGNLGFELSDATGAQMASGLATGGHYVAIGPFELETTGLHGFTLDSTELTGGYTLGLAELQPPIAIDPAAPLQGSLDVLGDRQFYSFDANAGDTLTLTLRHPGSDVHGQLRLLGPDATRAYFERLQLIRLQTTATIRERSNNPLQLDATGSYLLELGTYNPFPPDLGAYVGGWEVEVVLESAP